MGMRLPAPGTFFLIPGCASAIVPYCRGANRRSGLDPRASAAQVDDMRSHKVEDYLKAIYVLAARHGRAKTSALATQLGVTPGSVTDMLKRLAEQSPPLIDYQSHQGVTLTDRGARRALSVIRRHRLLETFLHDVLGFAWDEVHAEAEKLEHCLSERLTEAIAAHLKHPVCDPHGDPIPTREGEIRTPLGSPLTDLPADTPLQITRVRLQEEAALQYLAQNGLMIGVQCTIVEHSPLDGQVSLQLKRGPQRRSLSLGASVAAAIEARAI
jgi:DtxR family Mn-dependent transcriptional regulator